MTTKPDIEVKICGLKTGETVESAIAAGARYIGFNHFPKSPRYIDPAEAAELARLLPPAVIAVSLLVDPTDEDLQACSAWTDMVQLHGQESPQRCVEISALADKPILKAISVAGPGDVKHAADYKDVADMLLFDAKPPDDPAALPGGNAIAFDWRLLQEATPALPWMLSGGLTPENVAEAISLTRATRVDVSSGVESTRGEKSADLIKAFIRAATEA